MVSGGVGEAGAGIDCRIGLGHGAGGRGPPRCQLVGGCGERSTAVEYAVVVVQHLCARLNTPAIIPAPPTHPAGAPHPPLSDDELSGRDPSELQYRVTILEAEMGAMDADLEAIEKFKAADGEYGHRAGELEAATAARDEVRREGLCWGLQA